jgi:twinkle protein
MAGQMGKEIDRIKCPECVALKGDTSRNNLIVYDNGERYCMACGFLDKSNQSKNTKKDTNMRPLIAGAVEGLPERSLTIETCQKYNVRTVLFSGILSGDKAIENEIVKIFPVYDDGKVCKQKVKCKSDKKKQGQFGKTDSLKLFGMNTVIPTKNFKVIVTEGEEDAMSGYQMTGWPHVSVTRGASGAYKELAANLEWLSGFQEVVICFDNDEEGRNASSDCINLFEPGTVRNCRLPIKDANEMLKEGRSEEYKKCIWNAESIRPATVVFAKDIRDKVLTQPIFGENFPWSSMTKATYGRRLGESYLIAASTSVGKTEVMRALISQHIGMDRPVGYFQFEQQPEQTVQRFVGAAIGKRLHIPGVEWDAEKINVELDKIENLLALYNMHSNALSVESVLITIRYLYKCHGIDYFVVDNLKALSKNPIIDKKRVAMHEYASHCMILITSLCKELNINIFVVNHLSEDKISQQAYVTTSPKNKEEYLGRSAEEMQNFINRPGMTWETGRMPQIQNIFGGGGIKDLTDYIMVLARNRMSDDDVEHRTIRCKFLKTRLDSNFEGYEFRLVYNYQTGALEEVFDQEVDNRTQNYDGVKPTTDLTDTGSLE